MFTTDWAQTPHGQNRRSNNYPAVLTWDRENAGFTEDDLAAKLKVKADTVCAWETVSARTDTAGISECG
jgi:ribosome-binding protein aMBF1 (putative translation factor)